MTSDRAETNPVGQGRVVTVVHAGDSIKTVMDTTWGPVVCHVRAGPAPAKPRADHAESAGAEPRADRAWRRAQAHQRGHSTR
jgi:hypothetical protein